MCLPILGILGLAEHTKKKAPPHECVAPKEPVAIRGRRMTGPAAVYQPYDLNSGLARPLLQGRAHWRLQRPIGDQDRGAAKAEESCLALVTSSLCR